MKTHKNICLDRLKIRRVLQAIEEHWSIERLIINVNQDMDILGGIIMATDEDILSKHFCSGIVG